MLAIHARYRGREKRRSLFVQRSAEALSTLEGVIGFEVIDVEDIISGVTSPEAACNVIMALLSDGSWSLGLGISTSASSAADAASTALGTGGRVGSVSVLLEADPNTGSLASDIEASFELLAYVLSKRSPEGREATSLVRAGLNQNEAAKALDISKQAMSQRLRAAGWQAEQRGWQLAVNLISSAVSLVD